MAWYWIALVLGVIAPWIIMGSSLVSTFRERGVTQGVGEWIGMSYVTVPFIMLISWVATKVI